MRISDWSSDVCSSDLVDRHRAEDVAAALGGIHHRRFEIALDVIGQFDRRGRTDNLWVGVTPHAPLKVLHNKGDQALARVGIGPDKGNFLRSEEHPSELQAPMRKSYAAFCLKKTNKTKTENQRRSEQKKK